MARWVAPGLARHLTPAVAIETGIEATSNSFPDNDLGPRRGSIESHPWVSTWVATCVAQWVASEGGATPRFALAPDPAPIGAGPRPGVAPPSLGVTIVGTYQVVTGPSPVDCPALLSAVKAARFARPRDAGFGLDSASGEPQMALVDGSTGVCTCLRSAPHSSHESFPSTNR